MWISLYYANLRDPGFIPCNSPDYDMALKQVSEMKKKWEFAVVYPQTHGGWTSDLEVGGSSLVSAVLLFP